MKKDIIINNFSGSTSLEKFWKYLDDENDHSSYMIINLVFDLKNSGLECINKLEMCAEKLNKYFSTLPCNSFLACHYTDKLKWSSPFKTTNTSSTIENFFQSKAVDYFKKYQISDYSGALLLEKKSELYEFLSALITYPTVFKYQNIYVFCLGFPLIFEITHHSSIIFYTISQKTFNEIIIFCKNNDLTTILPT